MSTMFGQYSSFTDFFKQTHLQDRSEAQLQNQIALLEEISNTALHGAGKILDLSISTGRQNLDKAQAFGQHLIHSKHPQDVLSKGLHEWQPLLEGWYHYGQQVAHIASETGNQVLKIVSRNAGKVEADVLRTAGEVSRKFEKAVVKVVDEAVEAVEETVEDVVETVERASAKVASRVKKAARAPLKAAQHFPAHLPEPSLKSAKDEKDEAPKARAKSSAKAKAPAAEKVIVAKPAKKARPTKAATTPVTAPVEQAFPTAVNDQITDAVQPDLLQTPETLQE